MRAITINIRQGGGKRVPRIVAFIKGLDSDSVLLTEYRENKSGKALRSGLDELGYKWQTSSWRDPRENCVFFGSRRPFEMAVFEDIPGRCTHRVLIVRFNEIIVAGVYFPQKEEKRPIYDLLFSQVIPKLGNYGMIMGDFNTRKPFVDEHADTFACADCFVSLESAGLIDCWRSRNPASREFSWASSKGNGFRINHAFSTLKLNERIRLVNYLHRSREEAITDHSALLVEFDDEPVAPTGEVISLLSSNIKS